MATPSALNSFPGGVKGTVTMDGTAMGLVKSIQLIRSFQSAPIYAEEFGREIVDMVYTGATYRLIMALRGWDAKAITVFPNLSGTKVQYPGAKVAGRLLSADAVALVFTPDDATAGMPTITFAAAIPEAAEEMTVEYGLNREHLMLVSFLALRDSATPNGSVTWGPA